jgi:hypothetical protein
MSPAETIPALMGSFRRDLTGGVSSGLARRVRYAGAAFSGKLSGRFGRSSVSEATTTGDLVFGAGMATADSNSPDEPSTSAGKFGCWGFDKSRLRWPSKCETPGKCETTEVEEPLSRIGTAVSLLVSFFVS